MIDKFESIKPILEKEIKENLKKIDDLRSPIEQIIALQREVDRLRLLQSEFNRMWESNSGDGDE